MGSPLGPTFAGYYMKFIENTVVPSHSSRVKLYCKYVDDVSLMIDNEQTLLELKQLMENTSVLKFTY